MLFAQLSSQLDAQSWCSASWFYRLVFCLSYFIGSERMFSDISKLPLVWMHTDVCSWCCRRWSLRVPLPVFKGFKTLIWTHHIWYEAQHSLRYHAYHLFFFTPNLKTKGVPGTPGRWEDVHPADKLSSGTSVIHSPVPRGHSTHEDVQKERMSHYSHVQRRALYKLINDNLFFLYYKYI